MRLRGVIFMSLKKGKRGARVIVVMRRMMLTFDDNGTDC